MPFLKVVHAKSYIWYNFFKQRNILFFNKGMFKMSNMDIRGVFAVTFASVLFICIGFLIKKFNLAEMVAGYNIKKHEKHKEFISKYIGNLFFYSGLFALIAFAVNLIFKFISMSMLSSIVFGVVVLSTIITLLYVNITINKLDNSKDKNS